MRLLFRVLVRLNLLNFGVNVRPRLWILLLPMRPLRRMFGRLIRLIKLVVKHVATYVCLAVLRPLRLVILLSRCWPWRLGVTVILLFLCLNLLLAVNGTFALVRILKVLLLNCRHGSNLIWQLVTRLNSIARTLVNRRLRLLIPVKVMRFSLIAMRLLSARVNRLSLVRLLLIRLWRIGRLITPMIRVRIRLRPSCMSLMLR